MNTRTAAKTLRSSRTIVPPFPRRADTDSFIEWVKALLAWYQATRIARVLKAHGQKGAPVMAAGMAYRGLFSVFAALWAAFSIFGVVLASRPDAKKWVLNAIESALPGVIGHDGAINPDTLINATVFGWAGAIALVGTVWTALGWLAGTRTAIRTIFELPATGDIAFVVARLRDLALILLALVLVLLSSAFTAAGSGAVTWALGMFGIGGDWVVREILIEVTGYVVAVALDATLLGALVRFLANLRVPKRILFPAAIVGGIALTTIKSLAAMLVGGASANPLVATFAALLSVLILFNLMAIVQLLVAGWIKTTMDDLGVSPRLVTAEQAAVEATATAIRAQQELLAAEELELREELRDAMRFTHRAQKRRLREIQRERYEIEHHDLEMRMWNGDRPEAIPDARDRRERARR